MYIPRFVARSQTLCFFYYIGLRLQYRSKRRGFQFYVQGQVSLLLDYQVPGVGYPLDLPGEGCRPLSVPPAHRDQLAEARAGLWHNHLPVPPEVRQQGVRTGTCCWWCGCWTRHGHQRFEWRQAFISCVAKDDHGRSPSLTWHAIATATKVKSVPIV